MAIFELSDNSIIELTQTTFATEGLYERGDLQRLLRKHISVLEEGLLVIAEEFAEWTNANRRIDLLCLDRDANLVVIELKRTADGGHMDLQAIRYAAMVSAMTFGQLVDVYARQLDRVTPKDVEARSAILDHLGWSSPDEGQFNQEVRIILAAADFDRELTTAVVWLIEHGLDIRCVRLKPYKNTDGKLLLDVQQLIPLPEIADYQVQVGLKKQAERQQNADRHEERLHWWTDLLTYAATLTPLHANRAPNRDTWISGPTGRAGFSLTYFSRQNDSQVELWIACGDAEENLRAFHILQAQQAEIEREFGEPLEWQDLPDKKGCRVRKLVPGGYRSPVDEWPDIHQRLVDAMIRLEKSVRIRVQQLDLRERA